MLFNIPQFIDKEDKIVGPLTAKQLGWCAAGGVLVFLAWARLDFSGFIVASIPIILLTLALAFYRPNGMSLIFFFVSSMNFLYKPKVYLWRQLPKNQAPVSALQTPVDQNISRQRKKLDPERVKKITSLLNSK